MNKFKGTRPISDSRPVIQRYRVSGLDAGLNFAMSSRDLQPNFSHDLDGVMMYRGGVTAGEKLNALGSTISPDIVRCFCNHREELASTPFIRSRTFAVAASGTAVRDVYRFDTGVTDDWVSAGSASVSASDTGTGFSVLRSILNTLIYCESSGSSEPFYWDGTTTWTKLTGTNAITARDVIYFADRALYIGSKEDPQMIAWSITADPTDVSSTGSGSINLQGSGAQPTDSLVGGATIGSYAAIFRQRSIYRAFRTGSSALAIGVVPWISQVGCGYQHTIAQAGNGALFMGNDRMVYYISEEGVRAVGQSIHPVIRYHPILYEEYTNGVYNPVDNKYHIVFWDTGAPTTRIYTLDVGHFLSSGKERWTFRSMSATHPRLGVTDEDI